MATRRRKNTTPTSPGKRRRAASRTKNGREYEKNEARKKSKLKTSRPCKACRPGQQKEASQEEKELGETPGYCHIGSGPALACFPLAASLPFTPKTSQALTNFWSETSAKPPRSLTAPGEVVLYEIHGEENRTIIDIEDIPEDVIHATISVEDQEFYDHIGFDAVGITRALLTNVQEGEAAQGGSTITQQLVKNAILTNEKTFTRKIKELILSLEIEQPLLKRRNSPALLK